jgi:pre-rRNA-processing protein TSR4
MVWKQREFRSPLLFEEYEVTNDTEPSRDREKEEKKGKLLFKQYQKLEKRRAKKGIKDEYEYDDSFGTATKEVNIDPQFESFELRVSREPEQVLRFDGAPTPLWATSSNQPSADLHEIPACENCGSKRKFELQIMPQLLFFLKSNDDVKNSIEFGTLALYTCAASCKTKKETEPYLSEFVWRQPPV